MTQTAWTRNEPRGRITRDTTGEGEMQPHDDRRRKLLRTALRILAGAAGAYLLVLLLMFLFQKHFIYFPEKIPRKKKIALPNGDEEVWITVREAGRIHGIRHPAPQGRLTVLFLHGNARNILHYRSIYDGFSKNGFGVLMIDYPGFGKSEGAPSERALYETAHAAVAFLNKTGVENDRIVVFGKSLGTGVATELAASDRYAGLILESPFTDIAAVGQDKYWFLPVRLLLRESYDNLSRIAEVKCPLLVIVAEEDELVPPEQSREVFEKADGPKEMLTVPGAHHNDIQDVGGRRYWDSVKSWMEKLVR